MEPPGGAIGSESSKTKGARIRNRQHSRVSHRQPIQGDSFGSFLQEQEPEPNIGLVSEPSELGFRSCLGRQAGHLLLSGLVSEAVVGIGA